MESRGETQSKASWRFCVCCMISPPGHGASSRLSRGHRSTGVVGSNRIFLQLLFSTLSTKWPKVKVPKSSFWQHIYPIIDLANPPFILTTVSSCNSQTFLHTLTSGLLCVIPCILLPNSHKMWRCICGLFQTFCRGCQSFSKLSQRARGLRFKPNPKIWAFSSKWVFKCWDLGLVVQHSAAIVETKFQLRQTMKRWIGRDMAKLYVKNIILSASSFRTKRKRVFWHFLHTSVTRRGIQLIEWFICAITFTRHCFLKIFPGTVHRLMSTESIVRYYKDASRRSACVCVSRSRLNGRLSCCGRTSLKPRSCWSHPPFFGSPSHVSLAGCLHGCVCQPKTLS